MLNIDNNILLNAAEFAEYIQVDVRKARKLMKTEGQGIYAVQVGERNYVCKERYDEFVLGSLSDTKGRW
jgi:hypothetical protein